MESKTFKIIHAGRRLAEGGSPRYLFLRKKDPHHFEWFEERQGKEQETGVFAPHAEEAIRLAYRNWGMDHFRLIHCGFRYPLPERDEHGINALFHQMISSYTSMNGVYFDEDLGNNCFVQNASLEARELWGKLAKENRLGN